MKVLVAGCGSIGRRHVRNLALIGGHELGVFDPDESRREEALADVPDATPIATWDEALSWAPFATVLSSPTALHAEQALDVVGRGIHVLIEKPLAASLDDANRVTAAAEAAGVVLAVGYNNRYNPLFVAAKHVVDSGAIGRLVSGRAHFGSYLPDRHPWEDYRIGYGARADLGGGVLLDSVTHQVDCASWFFGEIVSVSCAIARLGDLDIDVEDTADVALRFASSAQVVLHGDFLERPPASTFDVLGTGGKLHIETFGGLLSWFTAEDSQWHEERPVFDANDSYVALMRAFLGAAVTGRTPIVDGRAGLANIRVLDAAQRSAATGKVVSL